MSEYSSELYIPTSGRINANRQRDKALKLQAEGKRVFFHNHSQGEDCNMDCEIFEPGGTDGS